MNSFQITPDAHYCLRLNSIHQSILIICKCYNVGRS